MAAYGVLDKVMQRVIKLSNDQLLQKTSEGLSALKFAGNSGLVIEIRSVVTEFGESVNKFGNRYSKALQAAKETRQYKVRPKNEIEANALCKHMAELIGQVEKDFDKSQECLEKLEDSVNGLTANKQADYLRQMRRRYNSAHAAFERLSKLCEENAENLVAALRAEIADIEAKLIEIDGSPEEAPGFVKLLKEYMYIGRGGVLMKSVETVGGIVVTTALTVIDWYSSVFFSFKETISKEQLVKIMKRKKEELSQLLEMLMKAKSISEIYSKKLPVLDRDITDWENRNNTLSYL